MRLLKTIALALVAAVGGVATPASAAVFVDGWTRDPMALYGGFIADDVDPGTAGAQLLQVEGDVGRFHVTGYDTDTLAAVSLYTYCIDMGTGFYYGLPFSQVPISAVLADSTKQAQLATLLVHGNPLVNNAGNAADAAEISAAISVAVWEIIYETGNAAYDTTAGNFHVYGDVGAFGPYATPISTRANSYLAAVTSGSWTAAAPSSIGALVPGNGISGPLSQAQVYLVPGVPEPSTWAMMIFGFGALGAMMRRRQRAMHCIAA